LEHRKESGDPNPVANLQLPDSPRHALLLLQHWNEDDQVKVEQIEEEIRQEKQQEGEG
jgi:hypothetical protein